MSLPLSQIPILGRKWWRHIADGAVGLIKRTTKKGIGIDGPFPAYSASYAKRKGAGKAGRITKGGTGSRQASTSTSPDLTLTGDMMRDLKTTSANDTSAVISWPALGDRVRWNAESGRAISSKREAFADDVKKYVNGEVDSAVQRNIKAARGSRTYRFGK